jgi:RNA polymerase sigma factor (sigma-70 family)
MSKYPKGFYQKYVGLAIWQANKFTGYEGAEFDDLLQECFCGLLKAWATYNTKYKTKFSTHAIFWMRAYIFNYLSDKIHLIYVPRYKRWEEKGKYHQENDTIVSLNKIVTEDDDIKLGDIIKDPKNYELDYEDKKDTEVKCWNLLEHLNKVHRKVLIAYYGIGKSRPRNICKIASKQGVSRQCVQQKLAKAIINLKKYIKFQELKEKLNVKKTLG